MLPVIIPGYKNQEQLDTCLQHLRRQTVPVEIFVRDNTKDNVFFTAALNEGMRAFLGSDCIYMILLNQDMYLYADAVEHMIAFMDAHPRCGIGAPLQLHPRNPEFVICAGSKEAFPAGQHFGGEISNFTRDQQILWANGACMILRKTMIQEIGLLDENFVFIGSDSDYSFTARSRGWQIWTIAAAKGIHEHGASGATADSATQALKIKDMIHFGKKWLTGDLYRGLAYESLTAQTVNHYMHQLQQALERLTTADPATPTPATGP